ncbi:MAG: DUF2461 domain-containing protein [Clostridiales bacterium]|nr:DUF2461 domain-containing protein [Clostridiales bacterium]
MFEGFSQQTVDFMWGIRFNNEKSWFEAHKSDFQTYFQTPMKELGEQVQRELLERFPKSALNLKVSRIYRDARRLFGRGPYKDHLWLSLFRFGNESGGDHPVLWFELAPDGWSYGMGFWCAQASLMEKHRARIDRDPKPLLKLHNKLTKQSEFALDGPEYSRKKPCAEPRLAEWYNKKSLTVGHEEGLTEFLYSPELASRLVEGFTFLMPYYDYFSTIWADPDPREAT